MVINERAGRAVAFYFIPENTDRKLDNCVSLDAPRLRALLRAIQARGHEIGIYPGYNTYKYPEALARSVATLAAPRARRGSCWSIATSAGASAATSPCCGTIRTSATPRIGGFTKRSSPEAS